MFRRLLKRKINQRRGTNAQVERLSKMLSVAVREFQPSPQLGPITAHAAESIKVGSRW